MRYASGGSTKWSGIHRPAVFTGIEADLKTVVPENSHQYPLTRMFGVNLPAYGLFLRHVKDVSITGLHLRPMPGEPRPELVADDVHGLAVNGLSSSHPNREKPRLKISNSTRIRVSGKHVRTA